MSNTVSTYIPTSSAITLTEKAIDHVKKQLLKVQGGIGISLSLKKSGCSGLSYVVEIIDHVTPDQTVYHISDHMIVAVSNKDLLYLQGTQIDFIQEGFNQKFKFINPNEKGSCGCGESFTI